MYYNHTKQKQKYVFVREMKVFFWGFLWVLQILAGHRYCLSKIYTIIGND